LQTSRSSQIGTALMFTSLLAHSGPVASAKVNFRVHKYVKPTSETSSTGAQDVSSQTWASWIIGLGAEATITGDEIDLICASIIRSPPQCLGLSTYAIQSRVPKFLKLLNNLWPHLRQAEALQGNSQPAVRHPWPTGARTCINN
jgi:hypothetical protein